MPYKGVPIRYRIILRWAVWLLSIASVAISFFALPTILAGIVSVVALIVPWVLSRTVFVSHVLWVMPPLSKESERNRLGTMWFQDELEGKPLLGLGLLYEDFEYAKQVYSLLRTWNFGRFIDESGNIRVSVISEGDHRYSMLICPGIRLQGEESLKSSILANSPQNTAAVVSRLFNYTVTCADYSDRLEVEEQIQNLKICRTLLLNTYFCEGNEIKPFAKRSFRLRQFRFLERSQINPKALEFYIYRSDGRALEPQKTKRTDELIRTMKDNPPQP